MVVWVVPVFLGAYALQVGVETLLLALNLRRAARTTGVPAALAGHLDDVTAARSRAYVLAHGRAGAAEGLLRAALTLGVLLLGVLPWLDGALAGLGLSGAHRFVGFLVALAVASGAIGLPFSIHRTFVVEARFGFNRTTPLLFALDLVKGALLEAVLGVPVLYATYGFMVWSGGAWWLWVFGLLVLVQLFVLWLQPSVIAPLFNRFSPLPDGALRTRLEALAREAGFRNRGLFLMDASRRSGHSNAYFMGLVRPRIVLYDTLVQRMDLDEAASVLAHEIGHFRRHHVHRLVARGLVAQLALLFVASRLLAWPPLYAAFGFPAPSLHAGLALLGLGGGAFLFWLTPLTARLSRRQEYEADRYAVQVARAPAALKRALVLLAGHNLANPTPHPWYAAWHYSHPTLAERLARVDEAALASGAEAR
jgi:STE24 endopeptidase